MPPEPLPVMLILRGIAGHFDGKDWPRGALYEEYALEYAQRRGYRGEVLNVAGSTSGAGLQRPQVKMCLDAIRSRKDVAALYGFSGGGYNLFHILHALTDEERARIRLVVVLGAPTIPGYTEAQWQRQFEGPWELVYRTDPPDGHMAGPQALLEETPHAVLV